MIATYVVSLLLIGLSGLLLDMHRRSWRKAQQNDASLGRASGGLHCRSTGAECRRAASLVYWASRSALNRLCLQPLADYDLPGVHRGRMPGHRRAGLN